MIIGVSGKAGTGKDTFADALADLGFVKISQADPMKRFCREVLGFTDEELWGPSSARNRPCERLGGLSARHALQTLGTEWGRVHCHDTMWIDHALTVARRLLFPLLEGDAPWKYTPQRGLYLGEEYEAPARGVVIPDVRFQNELDAIKAAGGRVVRLRRDGAGLQGASAMHASELEQDAIPDSAFDVMLENVGTVEDLRLAAGLIVEMYTP